MNKLISKIKGNKLVIFLYVLIYLMFLALVIMNVKNNYLGGDETYTFAMAHHKFISIIGLTAGDVHPFLYYFLARLFILPFKNFFVQIKALKVLSAVPYLIMLIIANVSIRKHFSNKVALLFMFFLSTMPVLVQHITIARMYGWTMLFTTLLFLMFTYIYKRIISNSAKSFSLITILAICSAYTHNYALISAFLMYFLFGIIFLCSKKHIKYLISSAAITFVCYLPWLRIVLTQISKTSSKNYWWRTFTFNFHDIKQFFSTIIISLFDNAPTPNPSLRSKVVTVGLAILITALITYFSCKYLHFDTDMMIITIGILLFIMVVLFGLLLDIKLKHIALYPRHLIGEIGIMWLCLSILLSDLLNTLNINKFSKTIMLIILVGIGMTSYYSSFKQTQIYNNQFSQTIKTIKKIPKHQDILYNNSGLMEQLSVYLIHDKNIMIGNNYANDIVWSSDPHKLSWGNFYKKTCTNIGYTNSLKINHHRHILIKIIPDNLQNNLSERFENKYKHKFYKIGPIEDPSCGKFIVYGIK